MFYYWDPTYILVLLGIALSGLASMYINSTYAKYSKISSKQKLTATQVASHILDEAGLQNIKVQRIKGNLTDNYNSQDKTLNLSETVADSTSVAAIGVAAHECGHALQDQKAYLPLRLRHQLVPVANFGSSLSFPLILLGVILGMNQTLIYLGILLFSLALLFQVVTLPVEINASRRALQTLEAEQLLASDELPMARSVLTAAALTYIAATLATFLQLIRLVLLFGNRRDN